MFPPQVPDLIGIKDRKYLDHTGLQLHRSIADMMRDAALNQGVDNLASYGGYYKVPSLKGVWYRGPFEHNGSVATLDDWFDERRLKNDYVPTGFKGAGVTARAVKGHRFGRWFAGI
jgi:hypothetical protein